MGDATNLPESRGRLPENLRSSTFDGLTEYSARLEEQRAALRSQRAWKIMLAIRKAYTLLFRRGFDGKLELARWVVRMPFAFFGDLSAYDIVWPELDAYLPENAREAIQDSRSF